MKQNSVSHVQLFVFPWTIYSMEFSEPEYWFGSLSLPQETFPTQGLNPGLLHWRRIIYQLSHQGSPRILGSKTCMVLTALFLIPKFRRKTLVVFLILWVKLDFIVLIKSTITAEERKKKKKKRKKIQKKLLNKSKYKNSIYFSWVTAVSVLSLAGSHSPPRLSRMPSNTVLVSGPAVGQLRL